MSRKGPSIFICRRRRGTRLRRLESTHTLNLPLITVNSPISTLGSRRSRMTVLTLSATRVRGIRRRSSRPASTGALSFPRKRSAHSGQNHSSTGTSSNGGLRHSRWNLRREIMKCKIERKVFKERDRQIRTDIRKHESERQSIYILTHCRIRRREAGDLLDRSFRKLRRKSGLPPGYRRLLWFLYFHTGSC